MVDAFSKLEERMYERTLQCINAIKPLLPPVVDALENLRYLEDQGTPSPLPEPYLT
jgi:hypothetical protein